MNPDCAFTVGARGSRLSLAQTRCAVAFLAQEFPGTGYRVTPVETPGDRDLTTPIEEGAPDFFTRDLDDAVRAGRIDFAIHSAKDLPETMAGDLDWFWLPLREDPRDCWVVRKGFDAASGTGAPRIGISSARRRAWAAARFPQARLLPIRGAVDARLRQLADGRFDAVVMAMAGLNRLYPDGLPDAIDVHPIALSDLPPPEAQGILAVVFRAGDARLMEMRARFVKAVRFVSAGVGDAGLLTVQGARDLAAADTVLHDDLMGAALRSAAAGTRRVIHVGKRCGAHSLPQAEITRLICDEARKGRRVVRLKGGDAGLFGRLAEETDALAALRIPFVVRPGVSALTAATTGTGMLLTRRGESRGFEVSTPRSAGAEMPRVMFMAARVAAAEAAKLIAGGLSPSTPCAIVWDAAGPSEQVEQSVLGTVRDRGFRTATEAPGLFIVGQVATRRWPKLGAWGGRRVLLTCSEAVQEQAALAVEDRGGRPIRQPLIRLVPSAAFRARAAAVADYQAIVLTSPSAVRIFFGTCPCDRRRLPAFYTCGAGTDAELRTFGVCSDVMPARDFSARGLIAEIARLDLTGRKILRLRSARAGAAVAEALRAAGGTVDDVVLYDNVDCAPARLPPFDDVFFASASAVEVFRRHYGDGAFAGKGVHVMGQPTRAALPPGVESHVFPIV
ncbi:MAG: SAM-dependent methyltransferase [Kiritimatiellia bacterium]